LNEAQHHFKESVGAGGRGVMRLDAPSGKKKVWRPHDRTLGLSEANVLY